MRRKKMEKMAERSSDRKAKRQAKEAKRLQKHKEQVEREEAEAKLKKPLGRRSKKPPEEFQGYYYDHSRQKFRVQFRFNGKQYRLGLYDTPELAHEMYLVEREKKIKELELQAAEFNKLVERREKIIERGGDINDPEWMEMIIEEEEQENVIDPSDLVPF